MAVHFAGIRLFSFKCESMDDDPDFEITGAWELVTCTACLAQKVAGQMAPPAPWFYPRVEIEREWPMERIEEE